MSETVEEKIPSQYIFGEKARKPVMIICAFIFGIAIAGQIASHKKNAEAQASFKQDATEFTFIDEFNENQARLEKARAAKGEK